MDKQFSHRILSPEVTWEKIEPYAKLFGVTRMAHIAGLDRIGVPVVAAIRPRSSTIVTASGKGLTWPAARVSGLMEALEVYCAEESAIPFITAPYNALQTTVIPLDKLPYRKNSLFHPDLPEKWTLGKDLISQQTVAAPLLSVTLNYLTSKSTSAPSFQTSSNGLASGNVYLEAVLSALYEVIERDGVSCHYFSAATTSFSSPNVQLETIRYPAVQELLSRLQHKNIGVLLSDCTVNTDVPIFMATLWDKQFRHVGITNGYGAHLDPEVAMLRALTEAIQSRAVFIAGARDDVFYPQFQLFKKKDNAEEITALEQADLTIDASHYRSEATPTLEGDLAILLEKLKKAGLHQALVFDLSRPEFDVSVVRVVVPGLEGYYSSTYCPGHRAVVKGFHLPAGAVL